MQTEILDKNENAALRVYAVSFHMLPSDHLARRLVWPDDIVADPRVVHYWDEDRRIGRWYEENETRSGEPGEGRVEWDAYFLYGPVATWQDEPPPLVSWGRTILGSRERLRRDLEGLLRAPPEAP